MSPISNPSGRRSSSDVPRYSTQEKGKGRDTSGTINGRGIHSVPASAGVVTGSGKVNKKYGLGQKPFFDITKAEDLCGLEEGGSST